MTDTERLDFYQSLSNGRYVFVNSPCGVVSAPSGMDESLSYSTIRDAIDAHKKYNEERGITKLDLHGSLNLDP